MVGGELVEERMSDSFTTTSEPWSEDEASFLKRPKVVYEYFMRRHLFVLSQWAQAVGQSLATVKKVK